MSRAQACILAATLTEARELARHADVRMTMKYTRIGLEARPERWRACLLPTHARTLIGWVLAGKMAAPGVTPGHRMTPIRPGSVPHQRAKPRRGRACVIV